MRTLLLPAAAAAGLVAASPAFASTVLDFDDLARAGTSYRYIDGGTFEYEGFVFKTFAPQTSNFIVFDTQSPQNADPGGATFSHRWDRTWMEVSRADGKAFDLISFDFADIYNAGRAFTNSVAFNYADGRNATRSYSADTQVGLQTLQLNETGLRSFMIAADPQQWWQLDNITVAESAQPGAVPEPATWAMMILGFGAAGGMIRRRRLATV